MFIVLKELWAILTLAVVPRLVRVVCLGPRENEIRPVLNWTKWTSSQLETHAGTPMVRTAIWDA